MRAARRSLSVLSCAACALACAVYRDDMVPHPQGAGSSSLDSAGSGSLAGAGHSGGGNSSGSGSGGGGSLGGLPSGSGTGGSEDAGASAGGEGPGVGSGGDGSGGEGGGNADAGGAGSGGASSGSAGQSTAGGAGGSGGALVGGSGGGGGSAGGPLAPTCSAHPLTPRSSWLASASHDNLGAAPAGNMLDNKTTRWTTGKPQAGDEWLELDFGASVSLNHVNLQQAEANANDYPRQYEVRVSDTSQDPNASAVASGSGANGVSTAITLPAVKTGQFLVIKQLGASLSWWSVVEIEVSCVD